MYGSADTFEPTRGGTWTSRATSTITDRTTGKGHKDTRTSRAASSTLYKNIKKVLSPGDLGDLKRLPRAHIQRHMNFEYGNFNP